MARKITAVGRYPVPGGIEIVTFTQTPRGTRVRDGSVVVFKGSKSKLEMRSAVASAIASLLPQAEKLG